MPLDDEWLTRSLTCTDGVAYDKRCHVCSTQLEMRYDEIIGPMILCVKQDYYRSEGIAERVDGVVPDSLNLGNTEYKLSACVYGDGSHFVSITRNFIEGVLYYCDGRQDNAQFLKQRFLHFPLDFKGKRLTDAFYVREEMYKTQQ